MRFALLGWMTPVVLVAAVLSGCTRGGVDYDHGKRMTGGDPEAGKQAIVMHDCSSCHVIPGIEGDVDVQGPSLSRWSTRSSIVNEWPNSPVNLEKWLRSSEELRPGTTMKLMNMNVKEARDIAAYLFSLN
jgi:cytochrome c